MKIAYVAQPNDSILPPNQNSLGLWVYEIARRLAPEHEITVYRAGGRWRKREQRRDGFTYIETPTAPDIAIQQVLRRLPPSRDLRRPRFAHGLHYLGYGLQVADDMRRRGCDIVHIKNYSQLVPVIRRLNPEARIILHMQCDWLSQLDPALIGPRLAKVDLVVGCSEHVAREVRRSFPTFAQRSLAIFNGVDIARYQAPVRTASAHPQVPRLLFVGRVSPEKGLHTLVEALPAVIAQFPKLQVEIVGATSQLARSLLVDLGRDERVRALGRFYDGDQTHGYYNYLRARLEALGIAGQVQFLGSLPHDEVFERCRLADLAVQPSLSEAFSFTAAEAMAMGLPVVASRVGGLAEVVVHGKTGLLVEPEEPEALAAALIRLLSNPELSRSMGRAGRLRVAEQFDWERLTAKVRSVYANVAVGIHA